MREASGTFKTTRYSVMRRNNVARTKLDARIEHDFVLETPEEFIYIGTICILCTQKDTSHLN
jgi:hypothetical protein